MDYSQMSMLETAIEILKNNNGKMKITELINRTLEAKNIQDNENEVATQLYLDITISSKFVFMGEDEWDLKDNQSLKEYDKDGADFIDQSAIEEDDVNVDLDIQDEQEDEDENKEDSDSDEDSEDYSTEYDTSSYSDDFEHDEDGNVLERYEEDNSFDEDEYNDYMDDFEDMYDND